MVKSRLFGGRNNASSSSSSSPSDSSTTDTNIEMENSKDEARDVELGVDHVGAVRSKEGIVKGESPQQPVDELLVTWDGPEDPECPFNWSRPMRWGLAILTSMGGLVTLMSGTMLAPALEKIGHDLDISVDATNIVLTAFVLAFAFGPMVLAPMTEVAGRRNVWLVCSAWYVLWNTVCGFAHTKGLMLASRILAGLGASAEFAVTNPVLADCWRPEERGHSFAIATFLPLLGPAIGPIIGGAITNTIGWCWLFWVLSIFDGALIVYAFFFFPETYQHLILHRKAVRLQRETGRAYHTQWDIHTKPLSTQLKNSLIRPCWMLATQPTLQLMSVFLAYNFGTLYFVLTSFATLWTEQYHQSITISGVHYIAIVIGYTIASQVGSRLTDLLWQHLKEKAGGKTAPEYRVPLMIPGVVLIPVGLFWYGWSAQAHMPWIMVDIGAAVFGCGIIVSTQSMQQYVIEAYRDYTASASAASQFLRSIFAFCFPIFAPSLYNHLGYGWGNSLLAFIFLGFGIPAPFILWTFGARLRARGKPTW